MTDQTDHRAAAAQFYDHSDEVLDDHAKPMGAAAAMSRAQFHLLAAIHDLIENLPYAIVKAADEYATQAEDLLKGTHDRIGSQCTRAGCLELHDPEPESVTVTLPRDVVEVMSAVGWRANAGVLRMRNFRGSADLLNALADALERRQRESVMSATDPLQAVAEVAVAAARPAIEREAKAAAWDEGANTAWERSTPEVNGQRYWWRTHGEPTNPYRIEREGQA